MGFGLIDLCEYESPLCHSGCALGKLHTFFIPQIPEESISSGFSLKLFVSFLYTVRLQ